MRAVLLALLVALPAAAPLAASAEPDEPAGFVLSLRATASWGPQDGATLGARPGATDAYDPGADRVEAPAPFGGAWMQTWVEAPASRADLSRLDRSFIGLGDSHAWSLRVATSGPGGEVVLAWSAEDVATVPPTLLVHLVHGSTVVDLRQATAFSFTVPAGTTTQALLLRAFVPEDALPSEPRNLTAVPGPSAGSVTLSWDPPEHEGAAPVQEYRIQRTLDGETQEVGSTNGTTFEDRGVPFGATPSYHVQAVNLYGGGEASDDAASVGTGSPVPVDPAPLPDEWRDVPLLDLAHRVPATPIQTPGVDAPLVRLQGAPNASDPRTYDVRLRALDRDAPLVTVFTAGFLPPLDVALLEAPPQGLVVPGASVHVRLLARCDGHGMQQGVRVFAHVEAGGAPLLAQEAFFAHPPLVAPPCA